MESSAFVHVRMAASQSRPEAIPVLPKPSAELCLNSPVRLEALDICVRVAHFLGLPKSVGECYGLLFLSAHPLNMDDLMNQLNLSKGATSQGLKQLRAYNAVRVVYVPGDRRDHYVAETNLRHLVSGFLRERVAPGLIDLGQRLSQLEQLVLDAPENANGDKAFFEERVAKLRTWQQQADSILPTVGKLLAG